MRCAFCFASVQALDSGLIQPSMCLSLRALLFPLVRLRSAEAGAEDFRRAKAQDIRKTSASKLEAKTKYVVRLGLPQSSHQIPQS